VGRPALAPAPLHENIESDRADMAKIEAAVRAA